VQVSGNKIIMKKTYLVFILVIIYLPLFPLHVCSSQAVPQSTPELLGVLKHIKEKEKTLKTFIAVFLQTKKSHLLRETLTSKGLIYVDLSGKVLIKVLHPSPVTLLLKDNMQIIFYPDSNKVKKKMIGSTDHILAKYMGIGQPLEVIQKQFEISLGDKISSERYHLKMIPKNAAARYIDLIEVEVNRKNGLFEHIFFKERQGDYTDIHLEYKAINEPIPAGIFSIELPEDNNNGNEER
jgi:outer membrane lipoprotein-sorting protein